MSDDTSFVNELFDTATIIRNEKVKETIASLLLHVKLLAKQAASRGEFSYRLCSSYLLDKEIKTGLKNQLSALGFKTSQEYSPSCGQFERSGVGTLPDVLIVSWHK